MPWRLGAEECCRKLSAGSRCCLGPHGSLRAFLCVCAFRYPPAHPVSDLIENTLWRSKWIARRDAGVPRHVENPSYFRVYWNPDIDNLPRLAFLVTDSIPSAQM